MKTPPKLHDREKPRRARGFSRSGPADLGPAYLEAILASMIDAVLVIDGAGMILRANPAAARIFGWTEAQLRGRNVATLMPPPHRHRHDGYLRRYLESGHSGVIGRRREMVGCRADGRDFPLELAVTEIRIDDRPLFVGLVRDLTEQQRIEAHLRAERDRAQRLQLELLEREKLATLGGLVAGVAHEVGTPLGSALLSATHGREKCDKLLKVIDIKTETKASPKTIQGLRQSFEIIESNLAQASRLMSSFKEVAVDQATEEHRRINLAAYLEDTLLALQPRLKRTGHRIDIDCPDDLELETYPGAISQIVTNLIMNSVIHGFEGMDSGQIRIEVVPGPAGTIEVAYHDNGCGIPAQHQDRVFTSLFSTRRGQGGSGLGLQIVYNLVTRVLRGKIDFSSRPGQGVELHLTIPAEPARRQQHDPMQAGNETPP